jgi:hypothetical protein
MGSLVWSAVRIVAVGQTDADNGKALTECRSHVDLEIAPGQSASDAAPNAYDLDNGFRQIQHPASNV